MESGNVPNYMDTSDTTFVCRGLKSVVLLLVLVLNFGIGSRTIECCYSFQRFFCFTPVLLWPLKTPFILHVWLYKFNMIPPSQILLQAYSILIDLLFFASIRNHHIALIIILASLTQYWAQIIFPCSSHAYFSVIVETIRTTVPSLYLILPCREVYSKMIHGVSKSCSLASIFNVHHPYPAPNLSSPVLLESNSKSDQMVNCIIEYPKIDINELQCLVATSYASLNNPSNQLLPNQLHVHNQHKFRITSQVFLTS